ncbi:MAG: hypothetical protein PHV34_15130 [Verrucomicrobiae bacterium]|nr:hypothetical protein [Verrucomicrobiae bacterium]
MAETILPDLQGCVLCEDVRQEINGNFILAGVIGGLVVPALPVTASKLCLFARWCCGRGKFHYRYRILLPDNTSMLAGAEGDFELASEEHHITQLSVFGNVQFQQAGTYWVEVYLEGELRLRFPLPLRVVAPRAADANPHVEPLN